MYSYISVICLLSIAAVAIGNSDVMAQKCRDVGPRLKKCCKNELLKKAFNNEEMMECHKLAKPLPSCELDLCMVKKIGAMSDDGTVNRKLIGDTFNKYYGLDTPTNDAIVEKCINGDISKYGKEDFCELLKMRICVELQLIENCPEWSNEGECEGAQDDLTDCAKAFQ